MNDSMRLHPIEESVQGAILDARELRDEDGVDSRSARYLELAITALEECEGWLEKARHAE